MRKPVLITAAVLLFAFYNYGLYQWVQSGHSFNDVWKAIVSDWLVTITVVDMGVLSLLCLFWLATDMRKRDWPTGKRMAVVTATLIVGAVVLLLYLAFKKEQPAKAE